MGDRTPHPVTAADMAILFTFRRERIQYPAVIASRSGLHIPYAERRCRWLADQGLLEQASGEVAYQLTATGHDYLDTQTDDT